MHINRAPIKGRIEKISYEKGKFYAAHLIKAEKNEKNHVMIANKDISVLVIQIAGAVARRIACWVDLATVAEELKDDTTRKKHIDNLKTSQRLFPDTEEWEFLAEDIQEWPVTPGEWEKGDCGYIEPVSRQAVSAESITYIYTSYLATIPVISDLFSDEKINIHVDGESVYSIVTEDKMIKDVYEHHLDDPTINIYTDMETSEKVASGELDIIDALEDGSINYEGVDFANMLKFGIANVFFDAYTFLSRIF
ncbi:MAG: phosphatidylserine decarboxylase [archaeon]|nr:phosphatidylserine decarboxylase [archaeon]